MAATKTMAGTNAPDQPKKVSRQIVIDFLKACGIDPNKTVSIHADVYRVTADHFDGARTIVEIQ